MDEKEPSINFQQKNLVVMSSSIQKFIHFGCWNNLNKELKETTNLKNVVEAIQKTIDTEQEPKIKLLTIAGDNYYPYKKNDKGSKKKWIFQKILKKELKKEWQK